MRRRLVGRAIVAVAGAAVILPGSAAAQTAAARPAPSGTAFVEGRDYAPLPMAQPSRTPGKIEVIEFFSYACPHCRDYDPMLQAWADKLPADVVFRRIPIAGMYNSPNFMRTYYALESLGQLRAIQPRIFAAVHDERLRLDKPEDIAAVVAKSGGDATKFLAAFKSFSVATGVSRAKKLMADYKIDSVPTLVIARTDATQASHDYAIDAVPTLTVGGVYATSVEMAKGGDTRMPTATAQARSLQIASMLIERGRHAGAGLR